MKEELPDIIGDLTGFNDLRDCFTKFNLMSCAGVIPWARVFKLIKSAGRVFNAVRKAIKWEDRVSAARALMTKWSDRVNDLIRKGMDKLNDLLPTKPPACVKHSFPAGTRVLMADVSSKPIEQVELGDTVLAAEQKTGRNVARKVVATWVHDDEPERTRVTLDVDGSGGDDTATLTGTDWHPVWEPKLRVWVPLANLQAGSWLQTSSGAWVQVTEVRKYHGTSKVHDLTVDGAHNYHVVAGGAAALVHNCGDTGPVYSDLDDLGRPGPAYAEVSPQTLADAANGLIGSTPSRRMTPAGFVGDVANHSRGHLIARQFGESGRTLLNLVTQGAAQNSGPIQVAENIIADHVRSTGNTVLMSVSPLHSGSDPIATHVLFEAVDDFGWSFVRRVPNI